MQVTFRRWPATIDHGFDESDDLAGVCGVTARPVARTEHKSVVGVEARLAGRLARLVDPDRTRGDAVFLADAFRENDSVLLRFLALLPSALLRLVLRFPAVRATLAGRERLLPPIPMPLPPGGGRVRLGLVERLSVTVPSDPASPPMVEGTVAFNVEVDPEELTQAEQRYRRIFGDQIKCDIRLGFLVFRERVRAAWQPRTALLHPSSRSVIEVGAPVADLRGQLQSAAQGGARTCTIDLSLDYSLIPETAAEGPCRFDQVVGITLSPEHDQDRNALLIVLTPMDGPAAEALGALTVRSVGVQIPPNLPPIEDAGVQHRALDRWKDITTDRNTTMSEDRFRWETQFRNPLSVAPGESLVLRIKCRNEATSLWERGGVATVTADCSYTETLAGISDQRSEQQADTPRCQMTDAFGRMPLPGARSLELQGRREITFTASVDLAGHDYLYTYVTTRKLDGDVAVPPNRLFAQTFAERLTESQILIRRVLESQFTAYEGRAIPFECNLYGRVEESMASPDIHVRIQSDQRPFVEITVSGKVSSDTERQGLDAIASDIAQVASEELGAAAQPSPAAGAWRDEGPDDDRLTRIESKLDRILERLGKIGAPGR